VEDFLSGRQHFNRGDNKNSISHSSRCAGVKNKTRDALNFSSKIISTLADAAVAVQPRRSESSNPSESAAAERSQGEKFRVTFPPIRLGGK
jgi:hypothetical protein